MKIVTRRVQICFENMIVYQEARRGVQGRAGNYEYECWSKYADIIIFIFITLIQRSPVVLSVTYLVFNLYFPTFFFFLYLDLGTASHYPQKTMPEYETITQGRAKRSTAGNRMRELLEKAHQEDDDELFKEVEDDEEFVAPRKLPTPLEC